MAAHDQDGGPPRPSPSQPEAPESDTRKPGTIITFYSYKGGVGRSLALVNVAYLLATEPEYGRSDVLVIDWDLEAPGLYRFFTRPDAPVQRDKPGLIEYVQEVSRICDAEGPAEGLQAERARVPEVVRFFEGLFERVRLESYLWRVDDIERISVLPAGRLDDGYAERVRQFDWERFYARQGAFFIHFRDLLMRRFRHTLIDSRTGLTDTSGICTRLLPERLVVVFAPNAQNLDGLQDVVRQAVRHRRSSSDVRGLAVFPLASRLDPTVSRLRELWWRGGSLQTVFGPAAGGTVEGYQPLFERLFKEVYELDSCNLETYFADTQVPHDSDYAYGERIAARVERKSAPSMSHSLANLTHRLVHTSAPWEVVDEAERFKQVASVQSRRIEELERAVVRSRRRRWYAVSVVACLAGLSALWVGTDRNLSAPAVVEELAVARDGSVALEVSSIPRAFRSGYETRLYPAGGGLPLILHRHGSDEGSLAFTPDGHSLVDRSGTYPVVWRWRGSAWVSTTLSCGTLMALSVDSERIACLWYSATDKPELHLSRVDGSADRVLRILEGVGTISAMAIVGASAETERVVVGAASGRVLLVSAADGSLVEAGRHTPSVEKIAVAPGGGRFATLAGQPAFTVQAWDLDSTELKMTPLPFPEGKEARDVVLNRDGSVAVLTRSEEVAQWISAGAFFAGTWTAFDVFAEELGDAHSGKLAIAPGELRPIVALNHQLGKVLVGAGDSVEARVEVRRATTWPDAMDDWGVWIGPLLSAMVAATAMWLGRRSVDSTPGGTPETPR